MLRRHRIVQAEGQPILFAVLGGAQIRGRSRQINVR
jgi:hypothetical protein